MSGSDNSVERFSRVFTPALHLYHPITITRGEGVYVHATDGQRYMDFSSGLAVLNIGHNHPRVMELVREQMHAFVHTGGVYYNETTVLAAEELVKVTPTGLDMLFFSNSGAEAVEGAIKLARYATGRPGVIAFTGAFHGRTLGAVSLTASSARYRRRYQPLLPSIYHVPYPTCFRCPFGRKPQSCELCCLDALKDTFQRLIVPEEVASIIIEPVLGEGGYFPAPPEFLQQLRVLCDRYGILLIFDEVQTGIGRTGSWFAAGHYGVAPDIMTVAKGVASGFPLSAVVATRKVMELWPSGAHGTTFGGNPLSCAAAIGTIRAITAEGLLENATILGERACQRFSELARQFPRIGDVRGIGFMIGIDLVDSEGNPDPHACTTVIDHCLQNGLILINCGTERNVIRFIPPLNTSEDELNRAIAILAEGIEKLR